jgi:hypothetical protein
VRASGSRLTLLRVGLLALAVPQAVVGLWASVPRFFHTAFPTADARWIAKLGLYNPHLSFDFGVSALALALVLAAAATLLRRELVLVALAAWLVWSVPHLAYHVVTAGELSTVENVVNLALLLLSVALPIGLLSLARASPLTSAGRAAKPPPP